MNKSTTPLETFPSWRCYPKPWESIVDFFQGGCQLWPHCVYWLHIVCCSVALWVQWRIRRASRCLLNKRHLLVPWVTISHSYQWEQLQKTSYTPQRLVNCNEKLLKLAVNKFQKNKQLQFLLSQKTLFLKLSQLIKQAHDTAVRLWSKLGIGSQSSDIKSGCRIHT